MAEIQTQTDIRNKLLDAIVERVLLAPETSRDRVKIGWMPLSAVDRSPTIMLQPMPAGEPHEEIDGEQTRRRFEVIVGVWVRIDPLSSTAQFKQIIKIYGLIAAQLELAVNDNLAGLAKKFYEDDAGPQVTGTDDGDLIAFCGCTWTASYDRELGKIDAT